jgi:hypothetical protein
VGIPSEATSKRNRKRGCGKILQRRGEWSGSLCRSDKERFRLPDYADAQDLYDSNRAYWERYYNPLPNAPDWKADFVRDSAAAASIPSRNNTFEYGFPDANSAQPSVSGVNASQPSSVVFDAGAPRLPFLAAASTNISVGLPGLPAEVSTIDPSNPDQSSPGGLPGMILDYLRNNPS